MFKKIIFFCLSPLFCFHAIGESKATKSVDKPSVAETEVKSKKEVELEAEPADKPPVEPPVESSVSAKGDSSSSNHLIGYREALEKYREKARLSWYYGMGFEFGKPYYPLSFRSGTYLGPGMYGGRIDDLRDTPRRRKGSDLDFALTLPIAFELQSTVFSQMDRLKWLLRAGAKLSFQKRSRYEKFMQTSGMMLLGFRYNFMPYRNGDHYFLGVLAGSTDFGENIQGSFLFGASYRFCDLEMDISPIYYLDADDSLGFDVTFILSVPITKWWAKKEKVPIIEESEAN